ncbi:unnamed protein product [Gordionus sp. m RMFG-2023]
MKYLYSNNNNNNTNYKSPGPPSKKTFSSSDIKYCTMSSQLFIQSSSSVSSVRFSCLPTPDSLIPPHIHIPSLSNQFNKNLHDLCSFPNPLAHVCPISPYPLLNPLVIIYSYSYSYPILITI